MFKAPEARSTASKTMKTKTAQRNTALAARKVQRTTQKFAPHFEEHTEEKGVREHSHILLQAVATEKSHQKEEFKDSSLLDVTPKYSSPDVNSAGIPWARAKRVRQTQFGSGAPAVRGSSCAAIGLPRLSALPVVTTGPIRFAARQIIITTILFVILVCGILTALTPCQLITWNSCILGFPALNQSKTSQAKHFVDPGSIPRSCDFVSDSFDYKEITFDITLEFPYGQETEAEDTLENFLGVILKVENYRSFAHHIAEMAATSAPSTGIPLTEYRKDCPPGWIPGDPDYPLKLFFQKLKLWYRVYDGPDESVGPLVAGRLGGRAQKIALNLRLVRPDGTYDVGDSALVRLSVDEVRDPADPTQIIQAHIPSGVQALAEALRDAFGQSDQELTTSSLESFFELRRNRLSLQEYAAEWELRYEEAQLRAGLEINDVAKTYLFFRNSGLHTRFVQDVSLQIQGDLSRFQEARRLALRLSSRGDANSLSTDLYSHQDEAAASSYNYGQSWDDNWGSDWDYEAWYADDWWWWNDDQTYWQSAEDPWLDGDPWQANADQASASTEWQSPQSPEEFNIFDENEEQQEHDGSVAAAQQEEYYQNKGGKGGKADGCFICGSRWHRVAQCPMNEKGKGGNAGKSSGRSWKGKSKGKGKWRPPMKGKGKGKRSYYTEFEHRERGQPEHGLRLDEERSTTAYAHNPIHMTPPTGSELLAWRKHSPDVDGEGGSPQVQAEDEAHAPDPVRKRLAFATKVHASAGSEHDMSFHTVRGQKRRGLLIDPGAAAGLVGSETLRDILQSCYPEDKSKDAVSWSESTATITGISGQPDQALGRVQLRLPFTGLEATFTADVIGKEGSLCPALVGNPALCEMKASLHSCWFENKDGLLVTWSNTDSGDPQMNLFRVLLTDSGHYLLPLDEDTSVKDQHEKVSNFIGHLSTVSQQHWPDHAYVFWQQASRTASPKQKWSHSEPISSCTATVDEILEVDKGQTFPSTTEELNDHNKKILSSEQPRLENQKKVTVSDAVETVSFEPKRADVQTEESENNDKVKTETIAPANPTQCPPTGDFALPIRETGADESTPLHFATNLSDLPMYQEDTLPDHLSKEERSKLASDYRAMPEEFYKKTHRRVVTPSSFPSWLREAKKKKAKWHCWELCSGSGRFSLICVLAGILTGFPVDFRYGWDIGLPEHQDLLWQAYEVMDPDVLMITPRCKFWSVASSRRNRQDLLQDRESERPALVFMQKLIDHQVRRGKAYLMEQPWSSSMWTESVMVQNNTLPGWKKAKRTDQCAFGACDERRQPVLKATGLESNIRLKLCIRRCNGHKGVPHAPLQGQHNGVNRTAMSAVYPLKFCRSLFHDILQYLYAKGFLKQRVHDVWHAQQILYTCDRCRFGRAALPDMEHSFIPGECRYGRDPKKSSSSSSSTASPVTEFQRTARSSMASAEVKIEVPPTWQISAEETVYLKAFLCRLVEETTPIFDEVKDGEYSRWIDDPITLTISRSCLKKIMYVQGIFIILHPFAKPFPEPKLSAQHSPLRLICRGEYKSWHVEPVEDLRELSEAQHREAVEEENWMVAFFGSEEDPSRRTRSSRTPGTPVPGTPLPEASAPSTPAPLELVPVATPSELVPVDAPYEDIDVQTSQLRTIKPLYSVKRVLQKLPTAVKNEPATARRLLLGLHEKLWHATAADFSSLLARAGMPPEVIDMASEAVAACSICRKYSRLPSKPRSRVHLAAYFGDEVELDIFYLWSKSFVLMVDVATRYKVSYETDSRELQDLLKGVMQHWIRYFGPMRILTSDQETALMAPSAATEFERLCITRNPKGTTSGAAGQQHTGTGLIERHVALIKLTMQKMKCECERQGLTTEDDDIAQEAAMSHNLCLTYGGYTPSMAVFGVLPRSFYEFESTTLTAVQGATDRDLSVFESAMRLRQISLSSVQQAIAEDRLVRASRSRPQKVDTSELVAGSSTVEIHRDGNWRGPATLLEMNEDEGTAIVKHQGKPYLLPIRCVRTFKGVFYNLETETSESLYAMMKLVEESQQYKIQFLGYKMVLSHTGHVWKLIPAQPNEELQKMIHSFKTWESWTQHPVHGVLYGQALKHFHPPAGTRGTVLIWLKGTSDFIKTSKMNDSPMKLKENYGAHWESLCFMYLIYYPVALEETHGSLPQPGAPALIPALPSDDQQQPPDLQPPEADDEMVIPDHTEEPPLPPRPPKREGEEPGEDIVSPPKKARTPSPKRPRLEGHFGVVQNYHTIHWMLDRSRRVRLHSADLWTQTLAVPQWFAKATMEMISNTVKIKHDSVQQNLGQYLVHVASAKERHFHLDLAHGGSFVSMTAEDNINEEDLYPIWEQVEESDAKEVAQFAQEKAFQKIKLTDVPEGTVIIDGTWVRRWKWKQGKRIVKSRMCARGCFDPQKEELATRSTTASRLSQRILISTAAVMRLDPESWDVSGAFLKGLTFDRIREILLKQGIKSPVRAVVVIPPCNMWRHLAKVDKQFDIAEWEIPYFGLWCLKPVYGLNDAPVAWQLSLGEFLKSRKGHSSHLDDSFYFWKDPKKEPSLQAALTTHVDDLAVVGSPEFMKYLYSEMCKEFGSISKDCLPFPHCGCLYSKTETGLKIDQSDFAMRMKPSSNPEGSDDRKLTAEEVTQFRSVLGGLLWLCSTRLDLVADVGVLQSAVTTAQVKHLRQANQLVEKARAKDRVQLGLHYRFFGANTRFRLQCIHDASSATKGRCYAQEGIMVLMMPELPDEILRQDDLECDDRVVDMLSNYGHILYAHGGKAKRVSYSTSHAETLSAIGGLEASSMVATRLSELWLKSAAPTLKELTHLQEGGSPLFPVDTSTDCRDFFELSTGTRAMAQDKLQRLYICAFKEARVTGRLRFFMLTPTQYMLADPLTKPMTAPMMMMALDSGFIQFGNAEKHHMVLRRLPTLQDLKEEDLYKPDSEILREVAAGSRTVMTCLVGVILRPSTRMFAMMAFLQTAAAEDDQTDPTPTNPIDWHFMLFIMVIYVLLRALEHLITTSISSLRSSSTSQSISSSHRTPSSSSMSTEEVGEQMPPPTSDAVRRRNQTSRNADENRILNLDAVEASSSRSRPEPAVRIPHQVWITASGECFHLSAGCGQLRNSRSTEARRLCALCRRTASSQSSSGV